jgi:uncharacterized membrane protein (UPF0182 family)
MTPGRRLLAGLVAAAVILLLGRAFALVYADYAWYSALGAVAVWEEKARDVAVVHTVSAAFAGLFALLNLFSIRRSIMSLAFPRRLGNVEFGEAVPTRYLDRVVMAFSVGIAAFMSLMVPEWQQLALLRSAPRFGESDPFFQADLSFYVAWLPLENATYMWTLGLLVTVSAVVIGLYALTPSLRWERGTFRLSVHVRRHLSVLGALFLLVMAWSYRLDGYHLLIHGTGANGMFSYIDHQWLIPAYLSLSVVAVAGSALVLVSGWTGQIRAIFYTVSAVLVCSVALDLVLPSVARRVGGSSADAANQQSYAATRAAYTRRAHGDSVSLSRPPREVTRFQPFGDVSRSAALIAEEGRRMLVYPGARGAAVVTNGTAIAAPALGSGMSRLAHAWAEQRLDLIWSSLPPEAKIARRRDVRERLEALVPTFALGSNVNPAFLGDTVVWVVELYSASDWYPLSTHFTLAGKDRSYFRHAGTALTNSVTGRVMIVADQSPDPLSTAWRTRFPELFRAGRPDILDVLTANPTGAGSGEAGRVQYPAGSDTAFRRAVSRLYARMRQSLMAGDLKGFGAAYDSLGAIIGHE